MSDLHPFEIVKADKEASRKLADELLNHASDVERQVNAAKAEVLKAFVAKHGFQPDEAEIIHEGNRWFVVKIDPAHVRKFQREIILSRLSQERFNWWQTFCLWCAGVRP